MALVYIINKQTSKDPTIMKWVATPFKLSADLGSQFLVLGPLMGSLS
jgi:hypothetical protein